MLNLNKLEIFAVVVRAGSFSAAAEQLLMTQPGVSQHIQDLEASLGTRLFVRGRRGVTLTPAGEKLAEYTRTIFRLLAEAERAVTDVEHLAAGELQLGATPGVSAYLLPEAIQELHTRYPNLTVMVQTSTTPEILAELRAGRMQIGFIEGELSESIDPHIAVQPLESVAQRVVVGRRHPWWGEASVEFECLGEQVLITRQRHSQTRIWLDGLLRARGIHPRIGAEFDNMESIKRAVANGKGVAILPTYAVQAELEGGVLWSPEVENPSLQRMLKLVWNRDRPFTPVAGAWLRCAARYLPDVNVDAIAGSR